MQTNKSRFPITYKHSNFYEADYFSLINGQWLTSEAINLNFILLHELYQVKNVKLLDPSLVNYLLFEDEEEELVKLTPLGLQHYDFLFMAINTNSDMAARGDHWCLAVLNLKQWTLSIYDSTGGVSHNVKKIKKVMQTLMGILLKNTPQIQLKVQKGIPMQNNSYDCGVFTIGYAQTLLKKLVNGQWGDKTQWSSFQNLRVALRKRVEQVIK